MTNGNRYNSATTPSRGGLTILITCSNHVVEYKDQIGLLPRGGKVWSRHHVYTISHHSSCVHTNQLEHRLKGSAREQE